MKTWAAWMQSRTLSAALAAAMVFPMGTPSVFAAYAPTDQLRPAATDQSDTARQLRGDADWALTAHVEQVQVEARRRAEELPQILLDAVTEAQDRTSSSAQSDVPAAVLDAMKLIQETAPPAIPGVSAAFHGAFQRMFEAYEINDPQQQQRIIDILAPIAGVTPVGQAHHEAARQLTHELSIDLSMAEAEVMQFATGLAMAEPTSSSSPIDQAVALAAVANPKAGPLYLGALVPKAASVGELVQSLSGIVEFTAEGTVNQILDEPRLRTETVHQLAAEAFLSPHPDVKAAAQWLLRDLGRKLGVAEASAYELHQARAAGKWGHMTIPAFNIRTGPPHHTLMTLFDAAIEQNVGLLMVEIAKSEQGYAVDIEEYVAQVYAAAIARGFTGPLFIQADHYQVAPSDYQKDPKKALDAMKKHLRRSIEGGMLNLDPDSSTLVNHTIVEEQILPLKMAYTNRYIRARMQTDDRFAQWITNHGGLKPQMYAAKEEDRESGEIRALRHKLWDDLLVVALESAGTGVLEEVLGQDALRLPQLKAYLDQLELTVEQEQARYVNPVTGEGRAYNSPELYEMSATGYHESLRGFVSPDELKQLIVLYREMQKDNLAVSHELLLFTRTVERELGLPTIDVSYEEEHTDTDILVNAHPSSALGAIVFTGLALKQAERDGVAPFTTLALQTGTMHGVGGNPDWGVHVRVNLTIDGSSIAGTDQHGTSTIKPERFADMPTAGVLSDHLATEYQKYTFAMIALVPELVDQFGDFLEGVLFPDRPIADPVIAAKVKGAAGKPSGDKLKKFQAAWEQAMREGEAAGKSRRDVIANLITDSKELGQVKGKLKDVTKLASKPFAVEISQLPPELKAQNYLQHVEEFRRIFRVQNVANSRAIVEEHAGFDAAKVVLPPPPTGLVQVLRRTLSREEAELRANEQLTTRTSWSREVLPAPGKENTVGISAAILHLRGDTSVPKGEKDTVAEEASDAITIARGDVEHVMAIEGELDVSYEELQAGGVHETGFVVNPYGRGEDVYVLRDDVEVTNGFHTDRASRPHDPSTSNPGTTSLRAWGEAVKKHGVVPEKYAAIVAANVPPAKVREYDAQPLDPFAWDPVDPHVGLLETITRLTTDSQRQIWDTEVVVMKRGRETAIKNALQRISAEHVGPNGERLLVTEVSDGTVDPARLAMAGRTEGRYLIAIEMGKSTEGTHNWFESGVLRYRGGVLGMRPVSKNINHVMKPDSQRVAVKDGATDHRSRLAWTTGEERDERTFRPQDAEARLAGKALYHQGNVPGDVEIAVSTRTDNPWFNLPGDLLLDDGDTVRTWTMRLSSKAVRERGNDLWVEVDEVSHREVERKIRNAAFISLPEDAQLQVQTNVVGELIRERVLDAADEQGIEVVRNLVARSHGQYRGKTERLTADQVIDQIAARLDGQHRPAIEAIVRTLPMPPPGPRAGNLPVTQVDDDALSAEVSVLAVSDFGTVDAGVDIDDVSEVTEGSAALEQGVETTTALLITPDEAASSVDIRDHRVIVVQSSVSGEESAEAMQSWIAEQLLYVQGGAESALHFVQVSEPAEVAGLLDSLSSTLPGSRVASVVGTTPEFVEAVKLHIQSPESVVGVVGSGAGAIRTAVAAALSEGRPNPALAKRLEVSEDGGLLIPKALAVLQETEAVMRAHQEKLRSIRAASGKV